MAVESRGRFSSGGTAEDEELLLISLVGGANKVLMVV